MQLLPTALLLLLLHARPAASCCSFYLSGTASQTPGYALCGGAASQSYTADPAAALDLSGGLSFSCAPPPAVFPLAASPRTLSLWVNCGGGQAPPSGFLSFAGYADASAGGPRFVLGARGDGLTLSAAAPSSPTDEVGAPAAPPACDGAWHFVAATLGASGDVTLFVDDGAGTLVTGFLSLFLPVMWEP
jgi:hypothetical protein